MDLAKYSSVWGSRVWGSRVWGSRVWGSTGLGPPISDLDPYLLALGVYTLGVYALGVYSLGPRVSHLELHMSVLKKKYRGPFNVNVV